MSDIEYVVNFGEHPSIDDCGALREKLVRCRDCRHYDRPNARCMKLGIDCYLADPQVSDLPGREHTFGDYGFCAWGERKEGGE